MRRHIDWNNFVCERAQLIRVPKGEEAQITTVAIKNLVVDIQLLVRLVNRTLDK